MAHSYKAQPYLKPDMDGVALNAWAKTYPHRKERHRDNAATRLEAQQALGDYEAQRVEMALFLEEEYG